MRGSIIKKVVVHIPNINLSQKHISLDLQHTGYTNTIYAQQGDIDSRQLTISLYDDGKNYNIPQDATVSLCGTRADKTVIYRDVDSFQNNVVTINFENAELAAKGIAQYKIEIKTTNENGQTQLLTSSAFKIKIYKNIYDENGKLASPQYSDLQRELDAMHKQEDEMKKATLNTINATNDLQNKLDSHHFVLTEDKDIAGGVAGLDSNTKVPNNRLYEASTSTKGITQLTDSVASNSSSLAATAKAVKTAYDKAASTENALNTHNSSTDAHEDIRDLISGLTSRLNALADSDDTTLDQLSEIVSYIKANRSLIGSVTTSKINVSDIVDNLTSTAANKVLSAKQGKVLNDLISSLNTAIGNKVDKVSGKGLSTNDYTTAEKNKLANIASGAEVNVQADWSETTTTSDSYIKNKPAIPTVGNGTVTIKQAGTAKGTFTMNQSGDTTIELTDNNTTYSNATTSASGLMSKDDKTKLDGIASGAEVNIQSDWNETNSSSDAYIKNKPTSLGTVDKLATARTISLGGDLVGSASFDGSANITINAHEKCATCSVQNTNNYPFHRFAYTNKVWSNNVIDYGSVFKIVKGRTTGGGVGIFQVRIRTERPGSLSKMQIKWLVRDENIPIDCIRAGFNNVFENTTVDLFYVSGLPYDGAVIYRMDNTSRQHVIVDGITTTYTIDMCNSYEVNDTTTSDKKGSSNVYATMSEAASALGKTFVSTVICSDSGVVSNANTLGGMSKEQFVHRENPIFDGALNCKKNIWFNGENDSKMMIEFLESDDANGHGISIGGGGMTVIGGGESANEVVKYYTNNRTVKNGGAEKMIVANDGKIEFLPNCQNGFDSAKHITMNMDGTITAEGFNGTATSAACVLDPITNKKTYLNRSSVNDFTYLAVWNSISGGEELRAFDIVDLKDKLGISSVATQSANGLMSAADKQKLDGLPTSGGNRRTLVTSPTVTETSNISFTLPGKDICKGIKLYVYLHQNGSQGSASAELVKTVILTQSAITDNTISVNGKEFTLSATSTKVVEGYVAAGAGFVLKCRCANISNAPLYLNNVSFTLDFGSPTSVSYSIDAVDL